MAAPESVPLPEKDAVARAPSVDSTARSLNLGDLVKELELQKKGDIAEGLYREIDHFTPEELEAEKVRVRRLIDWRIMPIVSHPCCCLRLIYMLTRADMYHLHNSVS